jgi:hypothetical protein
MNGGFYVARSSQVAARALGDEVMVMSAATSTLFTLNPVAALIWESADGATPLHEIVRSRICQEYDVAPELACRDAEKLVRELAEHGIFVVSDKPIQFPGAAPEEHL